MPMYGGLILVKSFLCPSVNSFFFADELSGEAVESSMDSATFCLKFFYNPLLQVPLCRVQQESYPSTFATCSSTRFCSAPPSDLQ